METQLSFWSLIRHCRKLIRTWSFAKWRISRGEYIISYLIISLLGAVIGTVLRNIGGQTGSDISSIIGLILGIFGIKLIIKRSHDLGKSGRYYFIPLFVLIVVIIAGAAYAFSQGLINFSEWSTAQLNSIPRAIWGAFGIALLASTIWFLVTVCMIIFKKGHQEENEYGSDPLAHQPSSNNNYWLVWLCVFFLSILIGSFWQPKSNNPYSNSTELRGSDTEVVNQSWAPEDYDTNEQNTSDKISSPDDTTTDY